VGYAVAKSKKRCTQVITERTPKSKASTDYRATGSTVHCFPMQTKCLVSECTEVAGDGPNPGWMYLSLEGLGPAREGALCCRHAYCIASFLNGEDVVLLREADKAQAPHRSTILVVDDDAAITDGLCELLTEEGYEVARASNGEEALCALRANPRIALIILDLMMPKMDGWSFRGAQRQDAAIAKIPAIVVSATPGLANKAVELQPAAVLPKPVDVETLLDRVERLCRERNPDVGGSGASRSPRFTKALPAGVQ